MDSSDVYIVEGRDFADAGRSDTKVCENTQKTQSRDAKVHRSSQMVLPNEDQTLPEESSRKKMR